MQSGDLEAVLKSEARKINNPDASLSLIDRATEYLSYLANLTKRELRARRLAHGLSSLKVPSQQILQPGQEEYNGSGVLSWINNKLGASIPARLAYTTPLAIAAVSPSVQGCATQELPKTAVSNTPAYGIEFGTQPQIDQRFADAFIRYLNSRSQDAYKILTEYGLKRIDPDFDRDLNKFLIDNKKGLLVERGGLVSTILHYEVIDSVGSNDSKRHSFFDIPIGKIERVFLGQVIYPQGAKPIGTAFYQNLGSVWDRRPIVAIRLNQLQEDISNSQRKLFMSLSPKEKDETARELLDALTIHEIAHAKHDGTNVRISDEEQSIDERIAYLAELGYKMPRNVKSVHDIIDYLQNTPLTNSYAGELLLRIKLEKERYSKIHNTARVGILNEMKRLSADLHDTARSMRGLKYIPEKDPFKAPDQQIWAMARYLYNKTIEKHLSFAPKLN